MKLGDRIPTFFRYAIVGGLSLLFYNGLSLLGAMVPGLVPYVRNAIVYLLVLVANYLGHRLFVFHRPDQRESVTVMKYLASAAFLWGLNQGLFYLGFNVLALPDAAVVLASSAIVPLVSYALIARLVFRRGSSTPRTRVRFGGTPGAARFLKAFLGIFASLMPFPSIVRTAIHRLRGVRIAELHGVAVSFNVRIDNVHPELLTIGSDVRLTRNVTILTHYRPSEAPARDFSGTVTAPVVIEDGVYIGMNAVILPGVRLGAGSLVEAGSVVTHDVPPHSVVAGDPAQVIKTLPGDPPWKGTPHA